MKLFYLCVKENKQGISHKFDNITYAEHNFDLPSRIHVCISFRARFRAQNCLNSSRVDALFDHLLLKFACWCLFRKRKPEFFFCSVQKKSDKYKVFTLFLWFLDFYLNYCLVAGKKFFVGGFYTPKFKNKIRIRFYKWPTDQLYDSNS